jgi:hypothetical protein
MKHNANAVGIHLFKHALSGFPPYLRRYRFGHRQVEASLIRGFSVKR